MPRNLVGVNELAQTLSVAPSWIYSRTRIKGDDQIPHIHVGKYVRFNIDEVINWLQNQQEAE